MASPMRRIVVSVCRMKIQNFKFANAYVNLCGQIENLRLKCNPLQVRYYARMISKPDLVNLSTAKERTRPKATPPTGTDKKAAATGSVEDDRPIAQKREDNHFLNVVHNIRNRTRRDKLGMTFISGANLIAEAISSGVDLKDVYFYNRQTLLSSLPQQILNDSKVRFLHASKTAFSKCFTADTSSADGLLAVFAIPSGPRNVPTSDGERLPITVICDNVRDPGNMGMIIQSSVAASCQRILVTKGCVDVWDPKVLQVGNGAHFHTDLVTNLDWKTIQESLPTESRVYLADSSSSAEQNEERSVLEEGVVPIQTYDSVDYRRDHTVVVIGGETEGISKSAYDLCCQMKSVGCRIHIPMLPGMSSLNAAVAGSVILFEIARQLKHCA